MAQEGRAALQAPERLATMCAACGHARLQKAQDGRDYKRWHKKDVQKCRVRSRPSHHTARSKEGCPATQIQDTQRKEEQRQCRGLNASAAGHAQLPGIKG
eukprot:1158500-Pelagomonas_calceolata.AAC.8